ncbi:type III polyketide synthase [Aquibacillus halophilus]|uniref:Type III polyketide synthase n=1 Tax=Aquibacillus halophilus TaxID=930132 RepID=A0A6A8D9M3_9BACI|nr:3-oxoacyl-[acyl-carrier-protein] synthase III C-terminal domain-containing protein [Aquibacillus halophilus]MRH42455.1 type III polyketide synthase [Aquibacillus halophilus]
MSYISSVGISTPEHNLSQNDVKQFVTANFPRPKRDIERLLPIFENANISNRQFVVEQSWFEREHSFEERNSLYQQKAIEHGERAINHCLTNTDFLTKTIPYEAVDAIIFVSSTGISTPSIDAHLLNRNKFRDDVVRIPLWGLGCAGGASGLARAKDWLTSHTKSCVLVVCVELCSLTFQKDDSKKSNFIGTALFGDGIAAALVIGEESSFLNNRRGLSPKIGLTSSKLKKDSLDVMGWDFTGHGFEVVFSKSIPQLVNTFWKEHLEIFLQELGLTRKDIPFFVAHPGGKKVLEAMEGVLEITSEALDHSYQVLNRHGNMSSSTVLYILAEWMKEDISAGEKSILSALGPGFSSELLSLEWSS